MILNCTKSLLDELKIKVGENDNQENPIFSWHCNVIKVNRKKMVVLVNDLMRCSVVLYGLKAKDFKQFESIVIKAIREMLESEHVKSDVVDRYIEDAGKITYSKTQGRSVVAKMNAIIRDVQCYIEDLNPEVMFQNKLSRVANGMMLKGQDEHYVYAYELVSEYLGDYFGINVKRTKAVELRITLDFEDYLSYRNIIVPETIFFSDLHTIIQKVFNWKNYHLHEFEFLKNNESIRRIISYDDDIPELLNQNKVLEQYVRLIDEINEDYDLVYTYDYGDCWRHKIEIVNYIDNYEFDYPVCTEGEGYVPPEDIGGEIGFLEFIEIIKNPHHPEHENMLAWSKEVGFEEFDKDVINGKINYSYYRV